jgi:predicted phage gp36 major capsid-like protein
MYYFQFQTNYLFMFNKKTVSDIQKFVNVFL